jgi:cystathionine gamma-synthase
VSAPDRGPATLAIHAGQAPDPTTGAVVPPLSLATTFVMDAVGVPRAGFDYSRSGNPARSALEETLAALEGGEAAFAFPSGLSAEDALLRVLTRAEDTVLFGQDVYGGTYRLLTTVLAAEGRRTVPVDAVDLAALARAMEAEPAVLLWLETPSNPLLQLADLPAIAALAHLHGLLLVVDNTFASPALQQPLRWGADAVVHSTTKLIGGHSDLVGGAVVTAEGLALPRGRSGPGGSRRVDAELDYLRNATGAVPGPFDAWLASRGLKTLRVRARQASSSAMAIADHLAGHPGVRQVFYPGLADHPGHEIALRQMDGFGTVVSFRCTGPQEARRVCEATRLFALAVSLGAVESLIEHPASMTHATKAGSESAIPDDLVRLAVGLEDVEDLIADLDQALAVASRPRAR